MEGPIEVVNEVERRLRDETSEEWRKGRGKVSAL